MKTIYIFLFALIFNTNNLAISAQPWKMISSGAEFSVGIRDDGTVWAWGANYWGQLSEFINQDTMIFPTQIGTDTDWDFVECGYDHVIAIKSNGSMWSWGSNWGGLLGQGTNTYFESTIRQIGNDYDWIKVSSSGTHNIALKKDSSLWVWGINNYKELLDSSETIISDPNQIGKWGKWIDIASGAFHSIALDESGDVWTWGRNNSGQLGNGEFSSFNISVPTKIQNISEVKQVVAGFSHSMALKNDGTVWAWGANYFGQLGFGFNDYANRNLPHQVDMDDSVVKIRAGGYAGFAINDDQTLYAWGYNTKGNLGISSTITTARPSKVTYMEHWTDIAPSDSWMLDTDIIGGHTIGLRYPSEKLCSTGANNLGQLGNNSLYSRLRFECDVQAISNINSSTFNENEITLYPNPGNGIFNISSDLNISRETKWTVTDYPGKELKTLRTDPSTGIDLSGLEPGLYILNIQIGGKQICKKIILQ